MNVISKHEAIDFAESVRKLVDALVDEGFEEDIATDFVMNLYCTVGRNA